MKRHAVWRVSKEKASHKIDVVVALAQAALAAVQGASVPRVYEYRGVPGERHGIDGYSRSTGTWIADRDNPYAHGEAVAEAEDLASAMGRGVGWGTSRRRWGLW